MNTQERREYDRIWRENNPERVRQKALTWRTAHPEEYLEYHRKRTAATPSKFHGLTRAEVHDKLRAQGGVCAICEATKPGRGKAPWHGDHDHENGVFRGVLCARCNLGLGLFGDSVVVMRRAIAYLRVKRK